MSKFEDPYPFRFTKTKLEQLYLKSLDFKNIFEKNHFDTILGKVFDKVGSSVGPKPDICKELENTRLKKLYDPLRCAAGKSYREYVQRLMKIFDC